MAPKHLVIIGNGIAGVSAAEEARRTDPEAQITLIGNEPNPYYYRSSLTEWITGELTDENILARTPVFYDEMGIKQITGVVSKVGPDQKQLLFEDGHKMTYDALCIATGAHSNTIPVKGMDPAEIITYRNMADASRIKSLLHPDVKVLIVGGGVLGLELAGGLQRMDIPGVSIVEYMGQVGRPLLDAPTAKWLEGIIKDGGYQVFLNDTIESVSSGTATLKSGAKLKFDLLVQSVGITPDFPEIPGLEVGKGIRVDASGRTNLPDIYACGDCVETYDPNADRWNTTRVWRECSAQGRAAGASMAGGRTTFS